MKHVFTVPRLAACLLCFGVLFTTACSKKSGCPAEDVRVQTDKEGMPKAGKTNSGLLPPKGSKKYKYKKYEKRKRKH